MQTYKNLSYIFNKKNSTNNYVLIFDKKENLFLKKWLFEFFLPEFDVVVFCGPSVQTPVGTSASPLEAQNRIQTLKKLASSDKKKIVITTLEAISRETVFTQSIDRFVFDIFVGQNIDQRQLATILERLGYSRVYGAYNSGEYAVRGEILDIVISDFGFRLELDFDKVVRIRNYNLSTQIGNKKLIERFTVCSASEVIFDQELLKLADDIDLKKNNKIVNFLKSGVRFFGIDSCIKQIYKKVSFFHEYCGDFVTISNCLKYKNSEDKNLHPFYKRNISNESVREFSVAQCINLYYRAQIENTGVESILKSLLQKLTKKILFCIKSRSALKTIEYFLSSNDIPFEHVSCFDQVQMFDRVYLASLEIEHSFSFCNTDIFTEFEILGKRESVVLSSGREEKSSSINSLSEWREGDFVVHDDYGIAELIGIVQLNVGANNRDFISLKYSNDDKLYIPVENIYKIKKYKDVNSEGVVLDKLCGTRWLTCKDRVKKRIQDIGKKLVETIAKRKLSQQKRLSYDIEAYQRFCNDFEFCETEGQINAIRDIENDLKKGILIDRLICGGAGFGKTEVAIRAAFMYVLSGFQVAMVVPTTILCRQHFNYFKKRFDNYGVKVGELSTMATKKELSEVRSNIKLGLVDITIGTQSIFSKYLDFSNLGLLIVDEEQSFGVKQKELLKEKYGQLGVLSISATPIPRTLHLSLSGVKDISVINSPPVSKSVTEVDVSEYNEDLIKFYIKRELNRSGQVFYISPRTKDLAQILNWVSNEFCNANVVVVHGKMCKKSISKIMEDFQNGAIDILISTSIVETGIHIVNANSMIINNANLFGLSQLYQLIGRVGRSSVQGNVLLVVKKEVFKDEKSISRMMMMKNKQFLSENLSMAIYDMDSRGVGNILGQEQSGNIKDVGIDLYKKMLAEEIENLKNKNQNSSYVRDVEIDLGLNAGIPSDYISDQSLRLVFYRRLSEVNNTEELDEVVSEIVDRFGEYGDSFALLIEEMKIKIDCRPLGIVSLKSDGSYARICFDKIGDKLHKELIFLIKSGKCSLASGYSNQISIKCQKNKSCICLVNEYIQRFKML